jgi:hypothetical protein
MPMGSARVKRSSENRYKLPSWSVCDKRKKKKKKKKTAALSRSYIAFIWPRTPTGQLITKQLSLGWEFAPVCLDIGAVVARRVARCGGDAKLRTVLGRPVVSVERENG